ncbi:MAG TPA: WYL domain-containing protein [Bacilli bacterium]|nr:WYL domain-containing protein [Bacilli bacterium]
MTTGSMEEMKIWVLSFGAEVEVERPAELKEAVIAEIEKMKKIYG